MKISHKVYVVKQQNGAALIGQRGYSSQDVAPRIYLTLAGAERAARKIDGGVFTIYIAAKEGTLIHQHGAHDTQISKALQLLGIRER